MHPRGQSTIRTIEKHSTFTQKELKDIENRAALVMKGDYTTEYKEAALQLSIAALKMYIILLQDELKEKGYEV